MSTLKVDTIQNAVGENLVFNNKNLIINGGMNVWQRSTSESVNTNTYSTVDRWRTIVNGLGVFTVSRSTDVPSAQGFSYSTKWDCTTADASPLPGDYLVFEQRLEGQNLQHLLKGTSSAKKVTLSFWVKSNKTGTYIAELYDVDNTRQISKSYTIDSASTWEKKELVFDGDTIGTLDNDNANSLSVLFWLGAGSTYSSGTLSTSWDATTNANRAAGVVNLADSTSNEFYITGCQIETGSVATDFEFEPYETTLNKCKRYYQRFDSGYGLTAFRGTSTTTYRRVSQNFSPEMRSSTIDITTSKYGGGSFNKEFSAVNAFSVELNQGNTTDWVRLISWIADAEL